MAEKPRHVKSSIESILKGGITYENRGKFQWNKFRFTD